MDYGTMSLAAILGDIKLKIKTRLRTDTKVPIRPVELDDILFGLIHLGHTSHWIT